LGRLADSLVECPLPGANPSALVVLIGFGSVIRLLA